jgi:inorganic pyrophosphatase
MERSVEAFTATDLPAAVNAIVEIPKGRRSKFEVDKNTGLLRLDRYLYSSSLYPLHQVVFPGILKGIARAAERTS